MRNIFVYFLITFGFCSLGAYGSTLQWELPTDFHIIDSCLTVLSSDESDIIYILGGYVNANNDFTEIDVLSWDTGDDSWTILKRDIVADIESATFNGAVVAANDKTSFLCSDNGVYLVQGYGDPNAAQNKMFYFKSSPSLFSKFAFVNLFLLIFVVLSIL